MNTKPFFKNLQLFFMTVVAVPLSLDKAVIDTLKNNLDAKISFVQVGENQAKTKSADAAFNSSGSLYINRTTSIEKTGSFFGETTRDKQFDFTASFTKPFRTGDLIQLQLRSTRLETNSFFYSINPSHDAELSLYAESPLFRRSREDIVTAGVKLAKINEDISFEEYRARVLDLLSTVITRYWQLVRSLKRLEVVNKNITVQKSLLDITRKKKEIGLVSPRELLRVESLYEEARLAVTNAVQELENIHDQMKILMNLKNDDFFNTEFNPTTYPDFPDTMPSVNPLLEAAYSNRPDVRQMKLFLAEENINLDIARDNTLPDIKLVGSLGTNALGKTYPDMASDLVSGEFYTANIGIKIDFPFSSEAARSNLQASELRKSEYELKVEQLSQKVLVDIRTSVRNLIIARQKREASLSQLKFTSRTLEIEREMLIEGLSYPQQVMESAHKKLLSEENLIDAETEYFIELVRLEQHAGILLNRWNIDIKRYYEEK